MNCVTLRQLFMLFLLCALASVIEAEQIVVSQQNSISDSLIDHLDRPVDLAFILETIEDEDRVLSVEDLQSGAFEDRWVRNLEKTFVSRDPSIRYWFRLRLHYAENVAQLDPLLVVKNHPQLLNDFIVWVPDETGAYREVITGGLRGYEDRDTAHIQYSFRLPVTDKPFQIFGMIDNVKVALPIVFPVSLMTRDQASEHNHQIENRMMIFYSVLGALLVYNGCLYLSLREKLYGIYLAFLLLSAISCASIDGALLRWIIPGDPEVNIQISSILGVVMAVVYAHFVWEALDSLTYAPRIRKVFQLLIVAGWVLVLHQCLTSSLRIATLVSQIYPALLMPFVFVAIIIAILKRHPTAVYLLIAELSTIILGSGFMFVMHGLIPINPFTMWMLHISFVGEVLLLSLALAARTRIAQLSAIDSLSKYESLYENSLEGLFQYDLIESNYKCNLSFAKIFGYNNLEQYYEETAKSQSKSVALEFTHYCAKLLQERKGLVQGEECKIPNPKTGEDVWISLNMTEVKNGEGIPIRVDGSAIDITEKILKEQERAEKELAQKEVEISEAKNQAKTQFFASMSHEFRTPLTAILGYTSLVENDSCDEVDKKNYISTISQSAQHLLQLINDVLDLSKIEAQKMDVENVPVRLTDILNQVRDFVWILAEQKKITLGIDLQFPLPKMLMSDPTRLKQALINLCSNSVKFTESGGVIIRVTFDESKNQLAFSVIDTGIGLHSDQLEKLFQAFVQAEQSTSRSYGGTGLGLHLSKLIANKLGGDIEVVSEFGEGSTFTLTIDVGEIDPIEWLEHEDDYDNRLDVSPSSIERQAREGHPVDSAVTEPKKEKVQLKVLLAEDNSVNQKLIGTFISQQGAAVTSACNGVEVIGECHQQAFDLILMDMDMPIMDGLSAVKILRATGYEGPIHALTGNVSLQAIQECEDVGCDGHLAKPLDTVKLAALLESISALAIR